MLHAKLVLSGHIVPVVESSHPTPDPLTLVRYRGIESRAGS